MQNQIHNYQILVSPCFSTYGSLGSGDFGGLHSDKGFSGNSHSHPILPARADQAADLAKLPDLSRRMGLGFHEFGRSVCFPRNERTDNGGEETHGVTRKAEIDVDTMLQNLQLSESEREGMVLPTGERESLPEVKWMAMPKHLTARTSVNNR